MARESRAAAVIPVEGWRANIPLIRAIGTSASIILSVMWLTWQGSMWVSRLETRLAAIENIAARKAEQSEMDHRFKSEAAATLHRFALMCARAPSAHKQWACVDAK